MKKKQRSYTIYLGGELFSLKHLIGNGWLAETIYEKSHGKFRCVLPQDFAVLRGRSARTIRDYNLRALVACDLAIPHHGHGIPVRVVLRPRRRAGGVQWDGSSTTSRGRSDGRRSSV